MDVRGSRGVSFEGSAAAPLELPSRNTLLALFALALAGCAVPVSGALDDNEANRVVVALDRASIDATKEPDPSSEGRWRVLVPRDDVARALSTMREEELPRPTPPGVLDAVAKGALVPSEAAEHAQLVAGIAGDLERSLEGIDGVLSARIHLNVPAPSPLRDTVPPRGSASVLVAHLGSTPPISADSVQRLVAGGVAGLLPTDVAVVMVSRAAPARPAADTGLGHVGPIAVARTSLRLLQGALVALVALVAVLAGATLVLHARLSRARGELAQHKPQSHG
jgi:type III secretion protein J